MQTMRNRRSPRVQDHPWRGPGGLTIGQTIGVGCAVLLTGALAWMSGYLPGAAGFWGIAGRMIGTGVVGGLLVVLFYAMADPDREPVVRQHVFYSLRRHTYSTEPPAARPIPIRRPSPLDAMRAWLAGGTMPWWARVLGTLAAAVVLVYGLYVVALAWPAFTYYPVTAWPSQPWTQTGLVGGVFVVVALVELAWFYAAPLRRLALRVHRGKDNKTC